ncbi:hypothetical protein ISR92_03410 [Patescibacteria group bacterium]|nr:hypothetical protein [Patescibacteria group bacterium]
MSPFSLVSVKMNHKVFTERFGARIASVAPTFKIIASGAIIYAMYPEKSVKEQKEVKLMLVLMLEITTSSAGNKEASA